MDTMDLGAVEMTVRGLVIGKCFRGRTVQDSHRIESKYIR